MAVDVDADLVNADWVKRTWDLLHIKTVEQLKAHLQAVGMSVAQFKKLPVYRANLDTLPWLKDL